MTLADRRAIFFEKPIPHWLDHEHPSTGWNAVARPWRGDGGASSGTPLPLSVALASAMGQSWTLDEAIDVTGIDADVLDRFMAGTDGLTLQQLDRIGAELRLRLCWANGSPVKRDCAYRRAQE